MKYHMRNYDGPKDFIRIRDFLKHSYYAFDKPCNWGLERWNWGRYHPCIFEGEAALHIRHFEGSIRLWENDAGTLAAVLNTEWREPNGEAWIQRIPEANALLPEILAEAERLLADPRDGMLHLEVYEHDEALVEAVKSRGYVQDDDENCWAVRELPGLAQPVLPPGFSLKSMDEPDASLFQHCRAMGLGFDHPDPADWCTSDDYRLVQTAPDYRPELNIVAVAPDGTYASLCILWYDDLNRFGVLEPVCTVPAYRKLGLGAAVIQEACNRAYRLGARLCYVGSGQDFYAAIGFDRRFKSRQWHKSVLKEDR